MWEKLKEIPLSNSWHMKATKTNRISNPHGVRKQYETTQIYLKQIIYLNMLKIMSYRCATPASKLTVYMFLLSIGYCKDSICCYTWQVKWFYILFIASIHYKCAVENVKCTKRIISCTNYSEMKRESAVYTKSFIILYLTKLMRYEITVMELLING